MPTPTFTFTVTANDGDPDATPPTDDTVTTFAVSSFEGEERISQPFEYRLTLRHADANLDFSKVVNQAAVLTMSQDAHDTPPVPTEVKVGGIVSSFRMTRQFDDGDVECEAVLVPELWRLRMSHGSQVFQALTTQEIVEAVLQEAGLSAYEFQLTETYRVREFCMQYQESNLSFIQRLLEYEGIYYYFDVGMDGEPRLIFSDDRAAAPAVEGLRTVTFGEGTGAMTPADDQVYRFVYNEQIVPQSVKVLDYDFESFEVEKEEPKRVVDVTTGGGDYARVGTYYEHGRYAVDDKAWVGSKSEDDGIADAATAAGTSRDAQLGRIAEIRAQELEARRQTVEAMSTASRIQAGHVFELDGHFRFDGDYLVTSVTHTYDGTTYYNGFACLPAAVQYRPPRVTPVPRVPGIMTAKVKGTADDEEAYLDEEGRYRVRFPFDPNGAGATEPSRPVRLAQPYAGKDYGMHFPNRADAEMVFACLDGDPDRPLGLSVVPNPWKHAPVPNTDLKLGSQNPAAGSAAADGSTTFDPLKNVIRTQRGHQLVMDDGDAGANIGVTMQAGTSLNDAGRDIYWGSKIELGGYRHMSPLEHALGITTFVIGWLKNTFTRDFPSMAGGVIEAVASQVLSDDYIDDTYGTTTPVGVNIYTDKHVNMTGKDGVNITSPNLFGIFSTALMPNNEDRSKNQYFAETIAKFIINTVWQDVVNGTAEEVLDIRKKSKEYETKKVKNPKSKIAFKWEENFKEQRVSALIFTLLQRTGVNISSAGELKLASLQSTSVAAGQGGLALKSYGSIEQKADLDVSIAAHQGVKISSKGVAYKEGGIFDAIEKGTGQHIGLQTLMGKIKAAIRKKRGLAPKDDDFKIELENEEGDIFLHTGTGDKKGGDIMLHAEGTGDVKAFANEGQLHGWSGDTAILEVGSRDGLGGDMAIAPLAAAKVKGRLHIAEKLSKLYNENQVLLQTVDDQSSQSYIKINKGDEIELKCGQASIVLKKNGDITFKGNNVKIEGMKNIDIKGNKITSKSQLDNTVDGMNVKLKASLDATVQGTMVNAKGQLTAIKGSLIKAGS